MANVLINENSMTAIANAIRAKNGQTTKYKPAQMADAISAISGDEPTGTVQITSNGTHNVKQYASAQVNVPAGITPTGSQTFTENGTYDVTNIAEAVVDVASGGGGVTPTRFYEGVVELQDVKALQMTIPVAHASNDVFLIYIEVIETGTVSDGVVTKDDDITLRYFMNPQVYVCPQSASLALKTQEGLTFNAQVGNVGTYYMSNTSKNGATTPTFKSVNFPAGDSFLVPSASAGQFFCEKGNYSKYRYKVWLF